MSNAKGSGNNNKLTQPAKVVAQTRSETNAVSSQDLRQRAQKAVAMPAAAVRAAMASAAKNAVPAVRVAYDVLSRLLSFVETGHALDHAFLKTIKRGIDSAHIGDAITKKTIGKAFADIARLNEVVTRVVSYNRTYTEVARSTDQPAKTLTKAPSQDTAKAQDVRVKTIGKNKFDTLTLSENFFKIVTFGRAVSEILNSVDVKKFTLSKPQVDVARSADLKATTLSKPKAETLSLAELKRLNLSKLANDISRASDADKLTFTKRINDFIFAVESSNVVYNYTVDNVSNSAPQLTQISDTLTRLISFVRTFTDVARTTETLKRVVTTPKADKQIVSDRLTRVVSFHKIFADSEHTADVLTRIVSFNRAFTDIPRAADAPAKRITKAPFVDSSRATDASKRTMTKRPADIARSTDVFSKVAQFSRAFSSAATSTVSVDIFSTVKNYNRLRTEVIRSTDAFNKVTTFRRLPAEIVRSVDLFRKVFFRPRSYADISRATDAFVKVVSYNRTKADTSRATDVFAKTMFRPRAVVDVSRTTDLITAKFIAKRLNSIAQASEVLIISGYQHPGTLPPNDIGRIRETFIKLVSFVRTFNDVAKAQETKKISLSKTAGTSYSVWSDFNELIVDNDTTQTLGSYRTEIISPFDAVGKYYSKVANKIATYYYNAYPIIDFAELSLARTAAVESTDPDFTTTTAFDQDQFFTYTDSYQADTERALVSDVVTRVVQATRAYADVALANETVGRKLERIVGDVKSNVFNDFNELFYTSEYYSTNNGVGATAFVTNNYPVFGITIVNNGVGYSIGQAFSLTTPNGDTVSFNIATINGSGGILTVNNIVGTAPRTTVQQSYFTDYAGITLGLATLDQDLVQYSALTYAYPGPDTLNVGPSASEAKRNVVGQDMQFTLKPRADGDTARYSDASSKQITKVARRYLPQGVIDDYADLYFGTTYDQELTQFLTTSWPESVSLVDTTSRVTLGPIKRNRDTAAVSESKTSTLSKPKADNANVYQTFVKTYNMSAGAYANRTWRDYAEINGFAYSQFAEMPIDYEGRYELIQVPETIGKVTTKPLHFESYVWRDYNELTFGTANDQDITFSWYNDSPTDIVRTADDARRTISPAKYETLAAQETFGKEISIGALGDYRSSAFFRDFLGIIPTGETGVNGDPIMDEDLVFKLRPGDRTDRYDAVDTNTKRINKTIFRTVAPYYSDFAELTFGTVYDQDLVQYQPTTRDDGATSADLYKKVSTFIRAFNEVVRANDTLLLSKNGLAYSTYVISAIVQSTRSQDVTGRQIVKAVGDYKSQTSIWQDFVELEINLELAQFYYRAPDSTLDISRTMDQKANFFTKQAGRTQNVLNVNTLDTDIFFNVDLQQLFSQDYVTEIIYTTDQPLLTYGKNLADIVRLPETLSRVISKGGVGDTIVDDWNTYSPLYLNYFSDLEDSLQKQYPPRRIDAVRSIDTVGNYYKKQVGFDPVNKWYTQFEYLTNDETILTEGVIENRDNTFPQQQFTKYLDELVYEYTEEQMWNPFRTENLYLSDIFTRVISAKRVYIETPQASDKASIQFAPLRGFSDTVKYSDARNIQYTKAGGANLYTIWSDYLELDASLDLTQSYQPYRIEYLRTIDAYVAKFTKASSDIVRTPETFVKNIQSNKSEILNPIELIGKFFNKPQVGDSTLTAWYDSYEILSYDPTLLTYGEIKTTRFDIGRANDAVGKNFNVKAGDFKSRTWYDFNEIDVPTGLTQYWTPYTFEPAKAFDSTTRNLNKRLKEIPRTTDTGSVRVFSSNSYVRDTSPYYASDYVNEGVTTVTF